MSALLSVRLRAGGWRYGILVFTLAVFAVYIASPVIQSGDSRLVIYEADNLVTHGTRNLASFGAIVDGWPCYRQGSQVISRYPYGTTLFDIPFQSVAVSVTKLLGSSAVKNLKTVQPRPLEKTLASAITALAAGAIVLVGLEIFGQLAPALVLGAIFAVGSALWSTASRGLWQQGPMALLYALSIWAFLRGRRRESPAHIALMGLLLGGAYVVRPTAAGVIGTTGLVLLFTWRRALIWFIPAVLLPVVPSTIYNLITYHSIGIPVYGENVINGIQPHVLTYIAGMMISPARGLLVYSPFVIFALVGLWIRRRELNGMDLIALVAVIGYWLVFADTTEWDAGAAYGPRYLTDILPFCAYLVAPVIGVLFIPLRRWRAPTAATAVVLSLAVGWGVFVNARGSLSWATQLWNSTPVWINPNSPRLWSWSDPPFFRTGHYTFADLYPSAIPAVTPQQLCIYN